MIGDTQQIFARWVDGQMRTEMLSLVLMLALSLVSVAPQPWELGQVTWSFRSLGFLISRVEKSHHLDGLVGRWVNGLVG